MPFSLLIDTATEEGIVAFAKKDQILWQEQIPCGLHHSQFILPAILRGSEALALGPKDLAFISCGVGPGSYTGMRAGASVAKAISYAKKIPLVGVSTMEGFTSSKAGDYAVLLDAKIGGVYLLLAQRNEHKIEIKVEPRLVSIEQLFEELGNTKTITTPHLEILQKKFLAFSPEISWMWEKRNISADLLQASSYTKFINKNFP